jgi:hypothetical protein
MKHTTLTMTTKEKAAWDRVKHAKVRAPDSAILSFVRTAGPELILITSLAEIRRVASAF